MPATQSADLEVTAASLLVIGFDGLEPTPESRQLFRRGVSGAIFFKRNVGSPPQIHALCSLLADEAKRPILLSVDQEGGRVARLRRGFSTIPPLRRIGLTGDAAVAARIGAILGRECRAVGFNLDFAPVVDVDSNPANPVIGDRSFGSDANVCATLGAAMIRGLQGQGVAACAKHFPGHGDTHQDSHTALPRLQHSIERLRAVELVPFRAAIAAGVASLMTAHVVFDSLDAGLPATLSKPALTFLRNEMPFQGVLISDDLEMAAVADQFETGEAAVLAIAAGCDLLLVCHRPDRQNAAIDALIQWAERSTANRDRLREAAGRVERLCATYGAAGPGLYDGSQLNDPADVAFLDGLGDSDGS